MDIRGKVEVVVKVDEVTSRRRPIEGHRAQHQQHSQQPYWEKRPGYHRGSCPRRGRRGFGRWSAHRTLPQFTRRSETLTPPFFSGYSATVTSLIAPAFAAIAVKLAINGTVQRAYGDRRAGPIMDL